jgi:hypothetical protein
MPRFLTHWGDPGGYKGATIEDAQKLHMEIWGEFQKHNPSIGSIFSLWMLHSGTYGKWKGYQGPETILNSDILSEIGKYAQFRIDLLAVRDGKKSPEEPSDWERPDGYLLDPEQQRVRQHMRELAKKKGARKD